MVWQKTISITIIFWRCSSFVIEINSDINERLLEDCFWSGNMTPVDLLFRTSGEVRLSDFMLWQTSYAPLVFDYTLWPDLTIWRIIMSVFEYQKHFDVIQEAKRKYEKRRREEDLTELKYCQLISDDEIDSYLEKRECRIKMFKLKLKEKKRQQWLKVLWETEGYLTFSDIRKETDENNNKDVILI
jgi:hypothetical protein